jgi:RNA polymerase sigma-70 factor, ECF subfamily
MTIDRCEEDAKLVHLARGGDVSAFAGLVHAYQDTAQGFAYSFCNSYEDAGDIVQEAFVLAYTKLSQLRTEEQFRPWFLSIVRSRALSWLHQRRRRHEIAPFESYDVNWECIAEAAIREHLLGERNGDIHSAIDELPEMYREVVLLHYWNSYSYDEISELLSLPHSTIKGRLQQSRRQLRNRLVGPVTKYLSEFLPRGRRVLDYDYHESAHRIAYTWAAGDDQIGITISDLSNGEIIREINEPVNQKDVRFSPDGEMITYAAEGLHGVYAVWICGVGSGNPETLVDETGIAANWPNWRPDGEAISYFRLEIDESIEVRNRLDGAHGLWEYDLSTGRSTAISDDTLKPMHRIIVRGDWFRDGNRFWYPHVLHAYGDYYPGVCIANRTEDGQWKTSAVPQTAGEMMTASHTAISPDGKSIVVICGQLDDRAAPKTLAVIDVDTMVQKWSYTGEHLTLAGFAADGKHLWCATSQEFLWLTYPGGTITARLLVIGLDSYRRRDFDPNVRPSSDGKDLMFLGADQRIHKWEIGGACEFIELPASELDDLGPVPHRLEETTFTARDGLEIPMKRYIPPDPRDVTVFVLGPVIKKWLTARLLRENYEVVEVRWRRQVPNFAWVDWVNEIGCVDAQDAVDCARSWSKRFGSGRPMAIAGTQAGGFLALRTLREPNTPFACGVTINAPMSVEGFEGGWTGMLDPSKREEIVRERCPITHAHEIRKPLLMIHGSRDVTTSEKPAMISEIVRREGTRCELVIYDDSHLLLRHRDKALQTIVRFLQDHR